jgi:hypothetical protein
VFDKLKPKQYGSDLRFLGFLNYNPGKKAFDRVDIVAVGECWGEYTGRYHGVDRPGGHARWPLGIVFELAPGDRPVDRIEPRMACRYLDPRGDYFGTGK